MIYQVMLYSSAVEVDDTASLVDMERNCPNFFSARFGKRRTYTVHRGCIIARYTVTRINGSSCRLTAVYLYLPKGFVDTKCPDMFCISAGDDPRNIAQAKKLIDMVLAKGSYGYGRILESAQ